MIEEPEEEDLEGVARAIASLLWIAICTVVLVILAFLLRS